MARVLVVEDEPQLRALTVEILSRADQVDSAATLAEALRRIAASEYDMLVTDLNLDHPSGGLLLAGAMRSLHPHACNVLITGYPDFTTALSAIQSFFDRIYTKPVDVFDLFHLHELRSCGTRDGAAPGKSTIWELIAAEHGRMLQAWLKLVEADTSLGSVAMATAERLDHMSQLLRGFAEPQGRPELERASANRHGRQRRELGYRADWILIEMSYLRRVIFEAVLRDLLELNLSAFPQSLFALNLRLDADLIESLRAFHDPASRDPAELA